MIKEINYAFIDTQNLNLGIKSQGWELDWGKFRLFLRNKYGVKKAFLFVGYIEKNSSLYRDLERVGYTLIFKKVLKIYKNKKITYKGNIDAELVLHTMIEIKNFDKAVIVSGDGDFYCLVEYLESLKKLCKVLTPNSRYSSLLRKYSSYILDISSLRKKLGKKGEAFPR
jgi:uncharacterized LabA/DUF88 family protein